MSIEVRRAIQNAMQRPQGTDAQVTPQEADAVIRAAVADNKVTRVEVKTIDTFAKKGVAEDSGAFLTQAIPELAKDEFYAASATLEKLNTAVNLFSGTRGGTPVQTAIQNAVTILPGERDARLTEVEADVLLTIANPQKRADVEAVRAMLNNAVPAGGIATQAIPELPADRFYASTTTIEKLQSFVNDSPFPPGRPAGPQEATP